MCAYGYIQSLGSIDNASLFFGVTQAEVEESFEKSHYKKGCISLYSLISFRRNVLEKPSNINIKHNIKASGRNTME